MSELTDKQKLDILIDYISCLEVDDKENSIRNATTCINDGGTTQLQVIVANHNYRAGKNHLINELREAIGLKPLKERDIPDWRMTGSKPISNEEVWDCPPLGDATFDEIMDGNARCFALGEECGTLVVIGTKSKPKALRLMRRLQRDMHDLDTDELVTEDALQQRKIVWRAASEELHDNMDSSHYFSWSNKHQDNPKAVECWLALLF